MADPTQVINTTTSIPDYARPYVEQLLGMTGGALYNYEKDANGQMVYRDAAGKIVPQGTAGAQPTPTGLQNYKPYPGERTAGYSDLQKQAYDAAKGLGYSPYSTGAASGLQGLAQRAGQYGYTPSSFDYTKATAPTLQNYQMKEPANVAAQQVNAGTINAAQTGYNPQLQNYQMKEPANVAAQQAYAAQLAAAPQTSAAQFYGPSAISYNPVTGERVTAPSLRDLQMQSAGNVTAQNVNAGNINAAQMGPAQQVSTSSFTAPGTVQQYMSPYQQAVTDIGKREAQRQADIAGTARGARAAQAGAFGGSRQAIENSEAQRNLSQQMSDIQAKGGQEAYNQAAQMFTSDQARQLAAQQANQQAGLSVGTQNLSAQQQANVQNIANQLQASGMNAQQALQAALANQGVQQQSNLQNLSAGLQTQGLGAQTGLTAQQLNQANAMQSGLANQQAGLTSGQFNATNAYNTALQNAQLQQQAALANQSLSGQYGLQQGQFQQAANMQNPQAALQAALANQQTGYNVGSQNLQANLGVQQLGTQTGLQTSLANLNNQQQANVQNIANQFQASGMNAQQALQAALANQQTGYNVGQQNLAANLGVQQLGSGQNLQAQLANQTANQQMQQLAEQSKQYGAGLGLQGLQAGMAGYQNLGAIGQNLYGQNIGNISTQAQLGGQQQQQAQNILNQQQQDFYNQQQFPYQQLSYMSNMLRGVPLSQGAQTVYQQPPSTLSQVAGAGLSLAGLSNLFGGTSKAKGGSIKEKKGGSAGLPAIVLSKMG